MPITERDIVMVVLGIVIALLLGLGNSIINASQQKWILIVGLAYVLFSIWKRRI